jgi:cytochrome c553
MTAEHTVKSVLRTTLSAVFLAMGVASEPVLAGGTPEAGMAKSATCEACHGKDGRGIDPTYPVLAGQYESYLIKALSDYRSGKRTNPIMAGMAAPLTNQDIEDLASWYASMQGLWDISGE